MDFNQYPAQDLFTRADIFSWTLEQPLNSPGPSTPSSSALSDSPSPSPTSASTVEPSPAPTSRPSKVSRPPNAFFLYRSHLVRDNKLKAKEQRQQNLSRVAGQAWNLLSTEESKYWYAMARKAKEAHLLLHPGYQFRPAPKGSRSRAKNSRPLKPKKLSEELISSIRAECTGLKGPAIVGRRTYQRRTKSKPKAKDRDAGSGLNEIVIPQVQPVPSLIYSESSAPTSPASSISVGSDCFSDPFMATPMQPALTNPTHQWNGTTTTPMFNNDPNLGWLAPLVAASAFPSGGLPTDSEGANSLPPIFNNTLPMDLPVNLQCNSSAIYLDSFTIEQPIPQQLAAAQDCFPPLPTELFGTFPDDAFGLNLRYSYPHHPSYTTPTAELPSSFFPGKAPDF